MTHAIHRVQAFSLNGDYRVDVEFEDGARQLIDFEPVLRGGLFGPLRDRLLFSQVRLDPEAATLVWPNGADFDPATLYAWPEVKESMAEMAKRWNDPGADHPSIG